MSKVLYQNASNTTTNGTAIGDDSERDIVVRKIIVGKPVSSGNIWLYSISNPLNASTANIACKITYPGTLSTGVNVDVIDFGPDGLLLNEGGNIIIDQTMQVTVIYDSRLDK